jgi:hypothetical protein
LYEDNPFQSGRNANFKDMVVMIAKHSDQGSVTGKKKKEKAKKAYRERKT